MRILRGQGQGGSPWRGCCDRLLCDGASQVEGNLAGPGGRAFPARHSRPRAHRAAVRHPRARRRLAGFSCALHGGQGGRLFPRRPERIAQYRPGARSAEGRARGSGGSGACRRSGGGLAGLQSEAATRWLPCPAGLPRATWRPVSRNGKAWRIRRELACRLPPPERAPRPVP